MIYSIFLSHKGQCLNNFKLDSHLRNRVPITTHFVPAVPKVVHKHPRAWGLAQAAGCPCSTGCWCEHFSRVHLGFLVQWGSVRARWGWPEGETWYQVQLRESMRYGWLAPSPHAELFLQSCAVQQEVYSKRKSILFPRTTTCVLGQCFFYYYFLPQGWGLWSCVCCISHFKILDEIRPHL